MSQQNLPAAPAPAPAPATGIPPKPGKVQAIAIMCLVDGILNILWGMSLGGGLLIGMVTACCAPLGAYPIVLGVLEIIYASKLLSASPPRDVKPVQYLAVMQIVNIVTGGVPSLVVGILSLVFYGEAEVKTWYDAVGRGGNPAA